MRLGIVLIFTIFSGIFTQIHCQTNIEYQLPQNRKYKPSEAIDSIHGIAIYERLNHRLSWDSVRNCKGYACNGLITDYYLDGSVLHKGFYVDGQLNNYSNYYPNGTVEREFKLIDDRRSIMNLYYPDGTLKSKHKYQDITPYYWEDFYPNGKASYLMEMSENIEYQSTKKFWSKDGTLLGELFLDNKKNLIFQQNEYYTDGKPKVKGHLIYEQTLHSFTKHGKWSYYDTDGKLSKSEIYEHDKLTE